jgi:hypothetical protein
MLVVPVSVFAQGDATQLNYGDVVTGEITNQAFEILYAFTGAAGDMVLIEMRPDDTSVFYTPSLILMDASMNPVASVEGYDVATLAVQLPADGVYNIMATRTDGRSGDGQGAYTLSLLLPPTLTAGEVVSGSLTNAETNYYILDLTSPVTLEYERTGGEFYPAVTVNEMVNTYDYYVELFEAALVEGKLVTHASVGLAMDPDATSALYVVTVAEGLWDWNYDLMSADYTLTITAE